MLFVVLTDAGVLTDPLEATSFSDAATQLKQLYGLGNGQVRISVLLPQLTGTLNQNPTDPTQATITMDAGQQNQANIRQNAQTALTNNATYLGIANPTTAQAVAQVRALTQQMDGVIRLLVGDFSATT